MRREAWPATFPPPQSVLHTAWAADVVKSVGKQMATERLWFSEALHAPRHGEGCVEYLERVRGKEETGNAWDSGVSAAEYGAVVVARMREDGHVRPFTS